MKDTSKTVATLIAGMALGAEIVGTLIALWKHGPDWWPVLLLLPGILMAAFMAFLVEINES